MIIFLHSCLCISFRELCFLLRLRSFEAMDISFDAADTQEGCSKQSHGAGEHQSCRAHTERECQQISDRDIQYEIRKEREQWDYLNVLQAA